MPLAALTDPAFHELLLAIDRDLAATAKSKGCPRCRGRLDSAHFRRQLRGIPESLGDAHRRRLSWCCAVEGCRKRVTPPSVRFLGRRVYSAAIVVLASALEHGLAGHRLVRLREILGVSPATIRRWRRWWLESFAGSPFWRSAQGLFATPLDLDQLPTSLLDRFRGDEPARLLAMLRFLALPALPPLASGHVP